MNARLAILYEHPIWFQPLFAELTRNGVRFEEWRAERLMWRAGKPNGVELVFNRMSASARWRGHECGQFATAAFLRHLEECGVETINGSRAYDYEISKARQLDLFRRCGVPFPGTVVVNHPGLLAEAASGLRFPIVVKPNCGGSGRGISRFDRVSELSNAKPDFGSDHTALVQEYVAPASGTILRVEVLAGEILYAMEVAATGFDLCPANTCAMGDRRFLDPPREVAAMALAMARQAGIDVGGFEFVFDSRSREWLCYDVNALSNFAPEAAAHLGFDPHERVVAYLQRRLAVPHR